VRGVIPFSLSVQAKVNAWGHAFLLFSSFTSVSSLFFFGLSGPRRARPLSPRIFFPSQIVPGGLLFPPSSAGPAGFGPPPYDAFIFFTRAVAPPRTFFHPHMGPAGRIFLFFLFGKDSEKVHLFSLFRGARRQIVPLFLFFSPGFYGGGPRRPFSHHTPPFFFLQPFSKRGADLRDFFFRTVIRESRRQGRFFLFLCVSSSGEDPSGGLHPLSFSFLSRSLSGLGGLLFSRGENTLQLFLTLFLNNAWNPPSLFFLPGFPKRPHLSYFSSCSLGSELRSPFPIHDLPPPFPLGVFFSGLLVGRTWTSLFLFFFFFPPRADMQPFFSDETVPPSDQRAGFTGKSRFFSVSRVMPTVSLFSFPFGSRFPF